MKKIAVVVDFDSKFLKNKGISNKCDVFVIDRLNDKIVNIEMSEDNAFLNAFDQEISFSEFYKTIANSYKEVFCLFLSYDYSNVEDYLMIDRINKKRLDKEARIYTYLLNYLNQDKDAIIDTALKMVNKDFNIRDIIVRLHNIRKKETISFNDLLKKILNLHNIKQ